MMKGTSKVIMGLTLVMVVSLALVLGLVLVLLAELYCTLLFRRRQLRITTAAATIAAPSHQSQPQTLSSFYAHGVLTAPRSFLFPAVSSGGSRMDIENQHSQLPEVYQPENQKPLSLADQQPVQTAYLEKGCTSNDTGFGGGCCDEFREQLVYISNPIYDNEGSRLSRVDTPFETPDTSPSRLETEDSSGEEGEIEKPMEKLSPATPPLTPMKELPAEACSVSMKDARSLGTSGSDSNSNNNGVSSSSSGTPCTSPSW